MKRELIPYYVSRAILAVLVGWYASTIKGLGAGIVMGGIMFAGFLWYAHSGRYLIDTTHPLYPLRLDARGNAIRDRAVRTGVGVAGLVILLFLILEWVFSLEMPSRSIALLVGVVTYFVVTNFLFTRR